MLNNEDLKKAYDAGFEAGYAERDAEAYEAYKTAMADISFAQDDPKT